MDSLLEAAVAAGDVVGVAAVAVDRDGVLFEGAAGVIGRGSSVAITGETVFGIASMTKPVTSVAAMQLVERGLIELDEPLVQRIGALADVQVLDGFEADGSARLRAPRRPITLRHLLTHTAGFAYSVWNADLKRYSGGTARAVGRAVLASPLVFDPGDRWEYGINTDWVGAVVEALSGQRLDAYFREHILDPLAMHDTGFVVDAARRQRMAIMHQREADGSLEPIPWPVPESVDFCAGGGGLVSTARDYARFLRMLLRGGELDGQRVLASDTVAEMYRNHIGDLPAGVLRTQDLTRSYDVELLRGVALRWSLGGLVNLEDVPGRRRAGSMAWAGLFNTYFWVDPNAGLGGALLSQSLPFGDPRVLQVLEAFERSVYASAAA